MRSCDDCPNNAGCAGENLFPVLNHVLALYGEGVTDKFDILFRLGEDDEALLERFTYQVSDVCWTKAALKAIAQALAAKADACTGDGDDMTTGIEQALAMALKAFARFPWHIDELIEQAPALHQAVLETDGSGAFAAAFPKRAFAKLCSSLAYAY